MRSYKVPWHYLTWQRPALAAEQEIALARLIRREGLFYLVRIFWGFVTATEGKFTWGCAEILLGHNYLGVICALGWALGIEDFSIVGAAWLITLIVGSTRYIGWLFWLLNRWPPMANN